MRTLPACTRIEVRLITETGDQRVEKSAAVELPDEAIRSLNDIPMLVGKILSEGLESHDLPGVERSANLA